MTVFFPLSAFLRFTGYAKGEHNVNKTKVKWHSSVAEEPTLKFQKALCYLRGDGGSQTHERAAFCICVASAPGKYCEVVRSNVSLSCFSIKLG